MSETLKTFPLREASSDPRSRALLDLYEAAELARLSSDSVNEPFLPEQHDRVFGEDSGLGSDSFAKNPFQPFDDLPDERRNALTFRAVALGILCGALVNASNIYMGLKSGWTFSGTIFSVSFDS